MVCVLPDEVWPKAKIVPLTPWINGDLPALDVETSIAPVTISCATVSYTCIVVLSGGRTASKAKICGTEVVVCRLVGVRLKALAVSPPFFSREFSGRTRMQTLTPESSLLALLIWLGVWAALPLVRAGPKIQKLSRLRFAFKYAYGIFLLYFYRCYHRAIRVISVIASRSDTF